jgi:hypothetical protein
MQGFGNVGTVNGRVLTVLLAVTEKDGREEQSEEIARRYDENVHEARPRDACSPRLKLPVCTHYITEAPSP